MGPIDETALQTLSLMTRVTENVTVDTDEEMKDIAPHMPKFYWIFNFSKLTDKENVEITSDQYLEQAYNIRRIHTKMVSGKRFEIHLCIVHWLHYKTVECR